MVAAAIYVRISQDREGAGLGVNRQEQDCRALADRKGWEVADVYVDNDVSAYSGKPRPAWRRVLADVDAGVIGGIICWHVDRLTRTPMELESVIAHAERHGLELATVSGDIDLATPTGRMVARMLGAAARHEAEHKAERQRRERRQSAERGRVSGGGTRPYGYGDDRVTVVNSEAAVIREAASRVLSGESLSSVCRDLAGRDVRTPAGNHWQPRTMRRLMASARISGRREHTPRDVYSGTRPLCGEIVATAVWPAIITPEESDRLRRLLADPERRRRFTPGRGRKYLLSGILVCGRCGHGMVGRPRSGVPRYVCPNVPGTSACGGVATNTARTDQLVRDMVLLALASPEMGASLLRSRDIDPELEAAVRRDEDALTDLVAEKDDGLISRGEYLSRRARLDSRLEANRAKLVRATEVAPLTLFSGNYDDLLARWNAKNLSQQRAIVGAVLQRVAVGPADPRRKWDPDRFQPLWRV